MINEIFQILEASKENENIESFGPKFDQLLESVGASQNEANDWTVNRTIRIKLAMRAVSEGSKLETVIDLLTWKDFEGFIAEILGEHNFRCVESFRRRGNKLQRGMEIDVIGERGRTLVVIDAKMWGVRKGKSSALMTAAEKQLERTRELCSELERLSKKIGELSSGRYTLIPMITTWLVEDVEFHEGVPIIPIFKFNSFILDLDRYEEMVVTVDCFVD